MKSKISKIKRIFTFLLIFLLSINSFAAVVADNDGSAFVTKGEFDSLKFDFAKQIDDYNTSIDSKIDGAIANYISGTMLATAEPLTLDASTMYTFPIIMDKYNYWNDVDSKYYSISVPDLNLKHFQFCMEKGNAIEYAQYDSSVTKMTKVSGRTANDYGLTCVNYVIGKSFKHDGFLNQVGAISGSRTIGGTAYGTRQRLTSGEGHDIVHYFGDSGSNSFFGGITKSASAIAAANVSAYHYVWWMCMSKCTTTTTAGKVSIDYTKRTPWTSTKLTYCQGGNAKNGLAVQPVSNFGTTFDTALTYVNNTITNYDAWAGSDGEMIGGRGITTSLFSWAKQNQQTRVYAGDAYCPAAVAGKWNLTAQAGMNNATKLDGVIQCDSTADVVTVYSNNKSTGGYVTPFYSFHYCIWPKLEANANTDMMPPDGTDFSMLPASLVYYTEKNKKVHYLDEGMFLQTFIKDGKTRFKLRFTGDTGIKINITLSKKPFNRDWTSADALPAKADGVAYTGTYTLDTSKGNTVEFAVDELKKNDDLYLYWEPATPSISAFCQLDAIDDFVFISEF